MYGPSTPRVLSCILRRKFKSSSHSDFNNYINSCFFPNQNGYIWYICHRFQIILQNTIRFARSIDSKLKMIANDDIHISSIENGLWIRLEVPNTYQRYYSFYNMNKNTGVMMRACCNSITEWKSLSRSHTHSTGFILKKRELHEIGLERKRQCNVTSRCCYQH